MESNPISGYELCSRILSHPSGGVAALIELAGGQETDWLEFKAALWPESGQFKLGENLDDCRWNVAKGLVAMANSRGGCVLVGICEKADGGKRALTAVDLSANPKKLAVPDARDKFMREVVEPAVNPPSGQWNCGDAGSWRLNEQPRPHFSYHWGEFQGLPVLAVLVQPVQKGGELCYVTQLNPERDVLLVKRLGDVGKTEERATRRKQEDWGANRSPSGEDLAGLWARFATSVAAEYPRELPENANVTDRRMLTREERRRLVKEWARRAIEPDEDWRKRSSPDVVRVLTPTAEEGDVEAQVLLGDCLYWWNGIALNPVRAAHWYRRAAEQGDARGQFALGMCYFCGKGVQLDFTQALSWFRKSAEQGDARAQSCLGQLYMNALGVPEDFAQAVHWLQKAARQGLSDALVALGWCYEQGNGLPQDIAEAVSCYGKAAEQGNAMAQAALGMCYHDGKGVPRDHDQAANWFRKAAAQGNPVAIMALTKLGN